MICSCCGYEIKEQPHTIAEGKKHVCDRCWNNPNLFFAEKTDVENKLQIISKMVEDRKNQPNYIEVNVIRLRQKGIDMYMGKMKAKDLLQLYEVEKFKEEELEGYQRNIYEERTSELVEYLSDCPLAVMPAILVSLREVDFTSKGEDLGKLSIPRNRGTIWIIDGQHRIGGFDKARESFVFSKSIDPSVTLDLMDYEFPVVFIDSSQAAKKIRSTQHQTQNGFSSEDVERTIFFIVNKTQRGISPSLKDTLLYRIKTSGIQGLPIVRKESWRVRAAKIVLSLEKDLDSPLVGLINISGRRGLAKPVQLNSFVSSLKKLLADEDFSELDYEIKLSFIRAYWTALRDMFPEAFAKNTARDYMLLKALGVYSLNLLGKDLFHICQKESANFSDKDFLLKILGPLETFDWKVQTSPLSNFGGVKGANEAHNLLLGIINHNNRETSGNQILQGYIGPSKNP